MDDMAKLKGRGTSSGPASSRSGKKVVAGKEPFHGAGAGADADAGGLDWEG